VEAVIDLGILFLVFGAVIREADKYFSVIVGLVLDH
jgi:hypothetical protein